MLSLDFTQNSVVIVCSACPWWSGFAFDRVEGWTRANGHERAFHPDETQAFKALDSVLRKARRFQETKCDSTIETCPPLQTSSAE